jgi:hypothetical protein
VEHPSLGQALPQGRQAHRGDPQGEDSTAEIWAAGWTTSSVPWHADIPSAGRERSRRRRVTDPALGPPTRGSSRPMPPLSMTRRPMNPAPHGSASSRGDGGPLAEERP